MITWQQEWLGIADRIRGLVRAASFLFKSLEGAGGDLYDAGDSYIIASAQAVITHLKAYQSAHAVNLPPTAVTALDDFLKRTEAMLKGMPPKGLPGVQGSITALTAFETEFTFLLRDHDSVARRLTERALAHLQRLIIVDEDYAVKWQKVFAVGETACEKLGAVNSVRLDIC